jgi:hypothetical protein
MANQFYSSDALSELRRILLAPEFLADALRPVLADLLREQIAQVADEVVEELKPALRATVRETLRDELSAPSPELLESLVLALEPSVAELLRQRANGSVRALAPLLRPSSRPVAEPVAQPQAPHIAESPASPEPEAIPEELPAGHAVPAQEARGKSARRGRRSIGGRRLLALGVALLSTVSSGAWGWSKVEALMISGDTMGRQVVSAGAVLPAPRALYIDSATPLPWIGAACEETLVGEADAEVDAGSPSEPTPDNAALPEETPLPEVLDPTGSGPVEEDLPTPEASAMPSDKPPARPRLCRGDRDRRDSLPKVTATYVAIRTTFPL